jgi:NAD(P)-dependent dehydrogenase (short-subunit alcohol dehydrogenase family)
MASVLITGTSKGIGFEAALAFGRAGHRVHATMRSPSQSPTLAETACARETPDYSFGDGRGLRRVRASGHRRN